jgi:peptidoglycan-associated lipoprotein
MKKSFLLLFSLLWLVSCKSALKKAEDKFLSAEYETAAQLYTKLLQNNPAGREALLNYKIGECYRLSNRLRQALPYYQAAQNAGGVAAETDAAASDHLGFYLGLALKADEKYPEAKTQLEKYAKGGTNGDLLRRARAEVRNLATVPGILEGKTETEIKNVDALNTPGAEYGPTFYQGSLVFASDRRKEKVFETTGQGFDDLYRFDFTDTTAQLGTASAFFPETFNLEGMHDAEAAFDPSNKFVIFARSNAGKKKEPFNDVHLFVSERHPERGWLEPKLLEGVTDTAYWDACPALSPDGKTLFFASNRKSGGAVGGNDLYMSQMAANGAWGRPRNLGRTINTPGDEMFPHLGPDGRLFFASSGHAGLGGLDLFVQDTVLVKDSLGKTQKNLQIKNLGKPVNSSYDDFGLAFKHRGAGYFTSNRVGDGAKGGDDIFYFKNDSANTKLVVYCLRGTIFANDKIAAGSQATPLTSAAVYLISGNGVTVDSTTSGPDGKYEFKSRLDMTVSYLVSAKKLDYFDAKTAFSTVGKAVNPRTLPLKMNTICFDVNLTLRKDLLSALKNKPNPSGGRLNPGSGSLDIVINYEYDSTRITTEASTILDEFLLYALPFVEANPNIRLELGSHTDVRGSANYNQKLSDGRAKAAVRYLVSKGLPEKNIVARGYGESTPKVLNAKTEPQHLENRRTTVKILK